MTAFGQRQSGKPPLRRSRKTLAPCMKWDSRCESVPFRCLKPSATTCMTPSRCCSQQRKFRATPISPHPRCLVRVVYERYSIFYAINIAQLQVYTTTSFCSWSWLLLAFLAATRAHRRRSAKQPYRRTWHNLGLPYLTEATASFLSFFWQPILEINPVKSLLLVGTTPFLQGSSVHHCCRT